MASINIETASCHLLAGSAILSHTKRTVHLPKDQSLMRFSAPSQHPRAAALSLLLCAALLLPACATSAIRQATPTPGPGKVLRIYSGHTSRVVAVAWSPDGKRVASASLDGTAQVWNSVSGTTLETFRSESGAMTSVAWSPTGDLLATG